MGKNKKQRQIFPKEQPKLLRDSFHLNTSQFKWTLKNCCWEHSGWKDCDNLQFFSEHIISKLQEYEKQSWQEIFDASGGKAEGN